MSPTLAALIDRARTLPPPSPEDREAMCRAWVAGEMTIRLRERLPGWFPSFVEQMARDLAEDRP